MSNGYKCHQPGYTILHWMIFYDTHDTHDTAHLFSRLLLDLPDYCKQVYKQVDDTH